VRGNFEGKRGGPFVKYRDSLPFAVQKQLIRSRCGLGVDSGGPKEACIRWDAHWRHLANTTELFMFGGDVALCQITMTTCSFMIYCINECFCPVFDFNLTVCGFLFNNYNKCSFLIISRSWIAGRILTCAKLFQSVSNGLLCQVIIVLFGKNMPLVLVT